jgi:large subunit ribosomal protein L13
MATNTPAEKQKTPAPLPVNMNNAFFLRKEDRAPQWKLIDAQGKVLGRLATHIATMLRGKDKALFTPHTDCGDYIVVINADKVVLTGNKWNAKEYIRHTLWMGGKKIETAREVKEKKPTELLLRAVKRMLPKNRLSADVLSKLKLYVGNEHPHQAQSPKLLSL